MCRGPILFIHQALEEAGTFLLCRPLLSSLTYPQAKALTLAIHRSAWGEGSLAFTSHWMTCHILVTCVVIIPLYLSYDLLVHHTTFIIVPLSPWQRQFL